MKNPSGISPDGIFFLANIDDGLELRQIPEHQVLADFFHRDALGLNELGRDGLFSVLEPRARAAAQLLGPERGDVYVKKSAFDRRGLLQHDRAFFCGGRLRVDDRVHLRDFSF